MNKPVTIAGGGLAGLSLGIALRREGIQTHVHEAGKYPRHRVCGEFISGLDGKTLETLGIEPLFANVRQNRTVRWFHGNRLMYSNELPEPALGVSRHRLDHQLSQHFLQLGGTIAMNSRMAPTHEEGLIWAAGRLARKSNWVGLKCHALHLPLTADLEMHMGTTGYVGLAGIEDHRVNVCGLFQCNQSTKAHGSGLLLAYLKAGGLTALAERLAHAEIDEASFLGAAGFHLGPQKAHPRLLTLGDAEAIIPPFTGHGMAMAFQAAETALAPLLHYAKGDRDWATVRHQIQTSLRARFRKRLLAARLLHPFLMTTAGRKTLELIGRYRCLPFHFLLRTLH